MKKYIILLSLFFSLSSCKKDITGHWHVTSKETKYPYEFSMDIDKNSSCHLINCLQYSNY